DDNLFNDGSIQEGIPNLEENVGKHETSSTDVQILRNSGNVSIQLSTGGHDVVPTTMVPVSRVFDRFRNMDCIIRPEIINFPNSSAKNVYQSHARGEYSDTTYCIMLHNEGSAINDCSTLGTQKPQNITQSRPLQTTMYNQPSSTINVPRRPQNQGDTTSYIDLGDTTSYIDLGDCDHECRHCGCLFWYNERLKGNDYGRRAKYHLCYGGGKIYMPLMPDHPVFIQQLLRDSHFMEHVRAYNQMFSMTSFGAKSTIQMQNFRGQDEDTLNLEIIEGLIHVLYEHNGLVRLFRTPRDRCSAGEIPGFKIRLYNKGGIHGYKLPTSDILGGIVFEDEPNSRTDFDSRLDWVCNHQNNLHSDYLLGLYDAVSRGDREGIQAGSKIMLPRTFTGGPRYMYSHYLDALDIRSKIRNAFEIDEYIFAEIPDPLEDPRGYKVVTEVTMHGPCGVANPAASSCWRIFEFPIHSREPDVQILNVHWENAQRVTFCERDRLDIIVNIPEKKKTTLTEWYVYNNENTDGRHLTYLDFPSEFVWYPNSKSWHQRAACEALVLHGGDKEWDIALEESTVSASSTEVRTLFAQISMYFDMKTVVLGDDFRQTLPVKKGVAKEELIHVSIAESYLGLHFKICKLKENMRLLRPGISNEERERFEICAKWLLDMGNSEIGKPDEDNNEDTSWITIQQQYCLTP
nr:helitron helicase-like domain-containing protein [Tanacetum cinerariifolium]